MFPEFLPRVIYRKRPSAEVLCQLRFPTILRIDTEPPAAFQEIIRRDYPNFQERPKSGLPSGIPPQISRLLGAEQPFWSPKLYEFSSSDKLWSV